MADQRINHNKDLIKKDLLIIRKLHQKTDYTQKAKIKAIYDYAISNDLLKTKLGEKYLNRLMTLYEGTDNIDSCIICGKSCEDNPIICNACIQKFSLVIEAPKDDIKQETKIDGYENVKTEKRDEPKGVEIDETKAVDKVDPMVIEKVKPKIEDKVESNVTISEKIEPKIENHAVKNDALPPTNSKKENPKKKKTIKNIGIVMAILIILCIIANLNPDKDNPSTVKNDTLVSKKQNHKDKFEVTSITPSIKLKKNNKKIGSEKVHVTKKIKGSVNTKQNNDKDSFLFTENELMSKIQVSLNCYNLDIGTKDGFPHFFIVTQNDTPSNVVYQTAVNKNGKIRFISVNISAPFDKMDLFGRSVVAAIKACDSKLTKDEANAIIISIHKKESITIHGISYFAGASTDHILTYIITKSDISKAEGNNTEKNSKNDTNTADISADNNIHHEKMKQKENYSQQNEYELSPLLGMTMDEVHKKIGAPLSIDDNTESYSDILSIVYENGIAYKIILGLDERFDFTQIEIPDNELSIQSIHLRDTEASVLNIAKQKSVFLSDGVFYGNTYQIKQNGYYVNIDYFTLQNMKECPVYRIVMTRLSPVN